MPDVRDRSERLHRRMSYELGGGAVFVAHFVLGPAALGLATAAVVVFLPLLARGLWVLERRGWLTALTVVGPGVAALAGAGPAATYVLGSTALLGFYELCAVLRMQVEAWQESAYWRSELASRAPASVG
ncbi:MAG: hypothetical protein R3362_04680 [Rhodothermales bacterium]|nr:hypothetical protein [Rhodothermales bacterium]